MGSVGSKLSSKEQVGYEVFFFTAIFGLYNVFFSNQVLIDAVVFTVLFGSLFIRYHLVVSDEDLSESGPARKTGMLLLIVSVAVVSHLAFRVIRIAADHSGGGVDKYVVLIGSAILGIVLFSVFNHPIFRYDEQRRETFRMRAQEDGPTGLIARIALFFDRQSERGSFELDTDSSLTPDETKRLLRKQREGEISTEEYDELKRVIKRRRAFIPILIVGFHALVSLVLLLVFAILFEAFTDVESVEMLGLILLVTGIYYSFLLLHTRFGLRRRVSRPLPQMPAELLLCILLAFGTLSTTGFIGNAGVLIVVPFTLYLFGNWSNLISQKMLSSLVMYFADTPDEYSGVIRDVLSDEAS